MLNIPGFLIKTQIYESDSSLVYRAIRTEDQQQMILKILKENYPTPEELARYRTEYEITKSLKLTGVVQVYDLQKYHNTLIMLMEDFGGESLRIFLENNSLTVAKFLPIAISITNTLAQIHQDNIIHKDLNPGNIVFNSTTEEVKIIDFGLATKLTPKNPIIKNLNLLEGTLAYISPEQTGRMNRSLDYRTDFYSLGVTFYQLLTNQLPFETTDTLELVHCHIARQPLPPAQLNPEIPTVLSDIIMKMMSKTAEERYQSAWGIKADLEQCWNQLQNIGNITNFPIATQDISEKFKLPQKLYGRDQEIEKLRTAFARVCDQSEMMLIAGYSGIGKTVLVQEIYQQISQKYGYFITGKFDQYQRNIPYSALVNAFQELIKQLLTESEIQHHQWKEKILTALGRNGKVIIDVIPEVELIIGHQPTIPELASNESQNRFNLVFENFIKVFTQPEHPLVIFIDDLQWADGASLKLIKLLMSYSAPGLFLIGAYREHEVSPVHPLMLTIEEIAKNDAIINRIYLSPLELPHVIQIISDTLNCEQEIVKNLAELVLLKTGGNPFFINEFLQSLYTENFLQFDLIKRKWQWDLDLIQAKQFTDNVVELMVGKIQKLPDDTQNLLKIAACIGNQFALEILGLMVKKSVGEIAIALQVAMAENLVITVGRMRDVELLIASTEFSDWSGSTIPSPSLIYKFVHDRIQQAAYSLIPDLQKIPTHYQIGQILLQQVYSESREEHIFELINQLNYGANLITSPTERDELAQLNLIACRKAKHTNAYQAGREYANIGLSLLGENAWTRQYEMTLAFSDLAAELAELCNDFTAMEEFIETVIIQAHSLLEQVNVYRIKIQSKSSQNKISEAIAIAQELLQKLGANLPEIPTKSDIQQAIAEIGELLKEREIEDLVNLPIMTDPEKIAIVEIGNRIIPAAKNAGSPLFPLLITLSVKLSIQYGNTAASAFAYGCYGIIACNLLQDINTGVKFGELAIQLVSQLDAKTIKGEILDVVSLFIIHRKSHIKKTLPLLQEGYQAALEVGNILFVGLNANTYCLNAFWCGQPLVTLEQEIRAYCYTLGQLNQLAPANWCRIYWQSILNLLGERENPIVLSGSALEEAKFLPLLQEAHDLLGLYLFALYQLILCYLFGEIELAKNHAAETRKYLMFCNGNVAEPGFYLYDSLTALSGLSSSSEERVEELARVEENQKQLQQLWAKYAPMNHQHKVDLVAAEKCRVLGERLAAIDLYDQAIKGAKENEYIQEVALACELAAQFYLAQSKDIIAKAYIQEACYYYQLWGARAKVKDLENKYAQMLITNQPKNYHNQHNIVTISDSQFNLDIATVVKASLAISREIMLDKLLSSLMTIVIQNAGAQRGYLISLTPGKLLIEAAGNIENGEIIILSSIASENSDLFAEAIVNYVARTKEIIVLNDATKPSKFSQDIYIKKYRPKSILCLPLINQNKIISILYLENNLTTGVFTPHRLEVLKLLSGQAAISLENAKLYTEVRENENRLNQFLEGIPVGIFIHDHKGKPLYTNSVAQQLLGQGITTDLTKDNLSLTYQVYRADTDQLYPHDQLPGISALKGESIRVDDIEFRHGDRVIPIEAWGKPIYDEKGNIIYGMGAFQDITERKKAEAERQRFTNELFKLNQAYERFVPRQFLQFLKKTSIIDVQLGDQVQVEMSILFSDIRDFTTLSEKMTPDNNFKFINSYLSRMEPAIIENQGFIDKYMGDAIMALFSGEADNAVKAGIAMLDCLVEYNQHRANCGYVPIQIGIGINTGALMLGTVGGENHMDGTVISDAVNLASRVEGLTKHYGASLLITEQTYMRLSYPDNYAMRIIGTVKVKGKSESVTMYEVFDADPREIKLGKLATLPTFTEALSLYNQGKLTLAMPLFVACLEQNPDDRVAQIYFQRCQQQDISQL